VTVSSPIFFIYETAFLFQISSPTLRLPLIIAIVMQLSQQLSGINAVKLLI
jgi:hypothetical protein